MFLLSRYLSVLCHVYINWLTDASSDPIPGQITSVMFVHYGPGTHSLRIKQPEHEAATDVFMEEVW
jgi:hypothetical protein